MGELPQQMLDSVVKLVELVEDLVLSCIKFVQKGVVRWRGVGHDDPFSDGACCPDKSAAVRADLWGGRQSAGRDKWADRAIHVGFSETRAGGRGPRHEGT